MPIAILVISTGSNSFEEPSAMYLQNKYSKYYYNIINQAKSRELAPNIYTEKHHIIPKSCGGDNSPANLVKLTAREHFICHFTIGWELGLGPKS